MLRRPPKALWPSIQRKQKQEALSMSDESHTLLEVQGVARGARDQGCEV